MSKPSFLSNAQQKHQICILCEGLEEEKYIERLLELGTWRDIYNFHVINVKSASTLFPRYQDLIQNNRYELVLIFCDTDTPPYREYAKLKENLVALTGKRNIADKIVMFANPCTLQIVLLHFGDSIVLLDSQSKKVNRGYIKELVGIKDYDAHHSQVKELVSKIFRSNYFTMKERLSSLTTSDNVLHSTNFGKFLQYFENDNDSWIKEILKYIN